MLASNPHSATTWTSTPSPPLAHGFFIPDLWKICHFPVNYHKSGEAMTAETQRWFQEVSKSQAPPALIRTVLACKPGELTAFVYNHSSVNFSGTQLTSDFLLLLFIMDDLSDLMNNQEVHNFKEKVGNVIELNSSTPEYSSGSTEEPLAAKLLRSWWARVCAQTTAQCWKERFLQHFHGCLGAMEEQALSRSSGYIPSIDEYIRLRRLTSGCIPSFDMIELSCGFELPDEVVSHPLMCLMKDAVNDFTAFSNDIFSYGNECSSPDPHNVVIILQKRYKLDIQSAVNYAGSLCANSVKMYSEARAKFPSFGPELDKDIAVYCYTLESWISGGLEWSFVAPRYFGDTAARDRIKKTRWVGLSNPVVDVNA